MKNPLRDEASAFQVVLITLAGAVLVVVAAWINTWLGLAVFIVLVGAALWAIRGGLMQRPPQAHVVRDEGRARRILVIANETVGGDELLAMLGLKAESVDEEMLLVCPALNSRVRTWTSATLSVIATPRNAVLMMFRCKKTCVSERSLRVMPKVRHRRRR